MTSKHILFALFVSLTSLAVANCKLLEHLEQLESNSIESPQRVNILRNRDWLKISEAPPTIIKATIGDRIEIECEMIGSPAPIIQWTTNQSPLARLTRFTTEKVRSNVRSSLQKQTGIVKMRSKMVIECVTTQDQGYYTCAARSGTRHVQAPPTFLLVEETTERPCGPQRGVIPKRPSIKEWSPTTMQPMGSNVVLPCVAEGIPSPVVYWLDQDNNLISDPRFQVLESGHLTIAGLSWSDMGQLTCVAENSEGKAMINTFVYPLGNA